MDLAALDALYETTEAKAAGEALPAVPEGRYQAMVDDADFKQTSTGKPMLALKLKITDTAHAGRKLFVNRVITTETVAYLKRDLLALGWEGKLSGLQDPLTRRALLERMVGITVKHKGADDKGRVNVDVYINERLATPVGAAADASLPPF